MKLYASEVLSVFSIIASPPSPGVPFSIEVGSTWITLGWSESSCDGGHVITEFILRYQKEVPDYYVSTYDYIYGISPALRNYTVYNLDPETSYIFSVQALSTEYEPSDFSDERAISTWREGEQYCALRLLSKIYKGKSPLPFAG